MLYKRLLAVVVCVFCLLAPSRVLAETVEEPMGQDRIIEATTETATASDSRTYWYTITINGGIMERPMVVNADLKYVYSNNGNNHISSYVEGFCTAYRPVPAELYDCEKVEISSATIGGRTGTKTSVAVWFDPEKHRATGQRMTLTANFYSSYDVKITAKNYMTSNCLPMTNSMTITKTMGV